MFFFDVDGSGISFGSIKREVHIIVILISNFDVYKFLTFLQEHRSVQLFSNILSFNHKAHFHPNIHHFIGIHIHCMEYFFLHCQDIEVS